MTNIINKHWRLMLLVLGVGVALWVLYLLRNALLPFAFGLVLVYLLKPVVYWLEKSMPGAGKWTGFKRVVSILLVFIVLLALIAVFVYLVITTVANASMVLLQNVPAIISRSIYQVQQWSQDLLALFPAEMQTQVNNALITGGQALGNNLRDAIISGISVVPRNLGVVFGFAVLPFFLFYIIKDSEKLKKGFYGVLSPNVAEHVRNIGCIIERVLGRYIRAQLMLGLIVAYFTFLGLLMLGVSFAPVLAIISGITELIPTLGPWVGGALAVIVTLAVAPDKAIWVAILALGIQVLENSLLVPRIQGGYLHIHPAIMIVLLVVGAYIAGIWGLLLAGPLTATAVEIYKYVHRCCTVKPDEQIADG
ncbi:MAG: AI-2E family transporter [Chloroflexota bacterium]